MYYDTYFYFLLFYEKQIDEVLTKYNFDVSLNLQNNSHCKNCITNRIKATS